MARATAALVDRLHREQPIALIDAHYVYPDGEAAMLHARRLGVPFVVSARGTDINLYPEIHAVRPRIVEVLQRADRVIAVSAALASRMTGLGARPERLEIIPNGVDTAIFSPTNRAEARAATGLPQGVPIVVTVGRSVSRALLVNSHAIPATSNHTEAARTTRNQRSVNARLIYPLPTTNDSVRPGAGTPTR